MGFEPPQQLIVALRRESRSDIVSLTGTSTTHVAIIVVVLPVHITAPPRFSLEDDAAPPQPRQYLDPFAVRHARGCLSFLLLVPLHLLCLLHVGKIQLLQSKMVPDEGRCAVSSLGEARGN